MSILSTGLSGLLNSRDGLGVSSNNVANANNPDYKRQQVQQETRLNQFVQGGYVGNGVQTTDVTRVTDQFLTNQILRTQSQAAYSETLGTQLSRVDDLFADGNNALRESLTEFGNAAQDLSTRPNDLPTRQDFLSKADFVVQQFNSVARRLDDLQDDNNSKIQFKVSEINGITENLATLNKQIAKEYAANDGKNLPLNLLDQRDALLETLSGSLGIQLVDDKLGQVNVFMKNGQPLVTRDSSVNLLAISDPTDPRSLVIAQQPVAGDGDPIRFTNRSLGEGELSALVDFKAGSLTRY
ncbi:MAG: flagellar hook-associated protein FlgK, partial [Limnobacter sp.]|nr:flagellar hook-associated protein FlgK [Limnobacter sp.]